MANTDDDGTCCGILIFAGLVAVLTMAPYLSLEAIDQNPGAVGTLLAVGFLALTAVGPFIPTWGAVVGAQWSLYLLWLTGYFTIVTDWTESVTDLADPSDGVDGFVLSLLLLVVVIVMAVVLYLAVPAAVGFAGGVLFDLPGLLAADARKRDPRQNWTAPQKPDADAAGPFAAPRWRAPHNERGDASLRRRRSRIAFALVVYTLTIAASLFVVFGPAEPRGAKYAWFAAVWALAVGAALVQSAVSRSVHRDLQQWQLPDDRYSRLHQDTVDQANRWAATVHPDDLRDGRPVVESLLRDSEDAMNRAQRLDAAAARESAAAGPGWTPPSVRELDQAQQALHTLNRRMLELLSAGESYADAREQAAARRRVEALQRDVDEELAVLDAATQTYWEYFADLWNRLADSGADSGLPTPDQFRRTRRCPAGLPTAELPHSLENIIDRVDDVLRKPPASERSWAAEFAGRSAEFRRQEQTLRGLADMVLAAGVRLSLAGSAGPAAPPLDDRGVDDLIRNIRARMEAEEEIERHWN